jgi:hypothetical protein
MRSGRRKLAIVVLGHALATVVLSPLAAQSPIGMDVRLNEPTDGFHNEAQVVALANGSWRAVWVERVVPDQILQPYPEWLVSRSIGPAGDFGPLQRLVQGWIPVRGLSSLFLTPVDSQHYRAFFGKGGNQWGITVDDAGHWIQSFHRSDIGGLLGIARRGEGQWTAIGASEGPCFWEVLDSDGTPILGPRSVQRGVNGNACPWGFAATPEGNGAIVWDVSANPIRTKSDVRARFFDSAGGLGPDFLVNRRPGRAVLPKVALLSGGREAWVAYEDNGPHPSRTLGDMYVQRVSFAGEQIGPEIPVAVGGHSTRGRQVPEIASDRYGNFVVAWSQISLGEAICGFTGRLYRANGRPVGPEFAFSADASQCGDGGHIAFADNGTFAAVWDLIVADFPPTRVDTYFARFSASPGDELCLVRGGHLLCDTGRTGGPPEIDHEVTGDPAATVLLGDVDGDGRADPCELLGNRLRCDLDHRGAPFEWERTVDAAEGTLLLGDVDGDGKADPCVWRAGSWSCQTASGELHEVFGLAGDVPLLGDLGGNHRADLCVWRQGTFLCDTAHDGGAHPLAIRFGLPGDTPLLGDFDGDGRADPCILRGQRLLCDTRHDGGQAAGELLIDVQAGDLPLFGNLDGL